MIQSLASVPVDVESVELSAIAASLTSGVFHRSPKETTDVCVRNWCIFIHVFNYYSLLVLFLCILGLYMYQQLLGEIRYTLCFEIKLDRTLPVVVRVTI